MSANLLNLRKAIKSNDSEHAVKLAETIYDKSTDLLCCGICVISFEDIGLANIPLVREIVKLFNKDYEIKKELIANKIREMCQSSKSKLCSYLNAIFYDVFVYEPNTNVEEKYEPFPKRQHDMINFVDPIDSIKIAGSMFIKGMDDQFWKLIYYGINDSDYQFINDVIQVSNIIGKHNNKLVSSIWIFALIWKYSLSNEVDIKKLEMSARLDNINILKRAKPLYKSSNYFYVHQLDELNLDNIPDNLKISRSDRNTYCIKEINSEDIIYSKYTFEEILEFSTAASKKKLHLKDLGVLQIPCLHEIRKTPYTLYCWLKNKDNCIRRYVLKPHATKDIAMKSNEFDKMIHKYKYDYHWCNPSRVICISEVCDGRIIDKKTYYTISQALPYFIPITIGLPNWKNTSLANQITLLNIMKYIFGIQNNSIKNCSIYLIKSENNICLRICSFNHVPILENTKNILCESIELKNLDSEKKWLQNIAEDFEKKYYIRLCEVITKI